MWRPQEGGMAYHFTIKALQKRLTNFLSAMWR